MQMSYSDLTFKNFCKLAQQAETIRNSAEKDFGYDYSFFRKLQREEFSCFTNAKVYAYNNLREQILFMQIAKLKKFSILKNSPCPLTQSIKVHRRAMVLLPCLIPCHRCENSQPSPFLIMQRDNIHARTHDTCVEQREYMTSGWRNLF